MNIFYCACFSVRQASLRVEKALRKSINYSVLLLLPILLSGCAAGEMFMAGYKSPQTIADLMREQNKLAANMGSGGGRLYPNVQDESPGESRFKKRTKSDISLSTYQRSPSTHQQVMVQNRNGYVASFTHKSIHDYAAQLAMNIYSNARQLPQSAAIAVTSFVKLDYTLQNTTILGNQLAEYTLLEMQRFGLNMIDFKLMPAIEVNGKGDLIFARDVKKLARKQKMDYVLSATMIERDDGVFINARIINMDKNSVAASGSVLIPHFIVNQIHPQFAVH